MLGAVARKFFGSANERRIRAYRPRVDAINALEKELERLSDEALRARTEAFRKELADGKALDDILVPAFATVREASKRTLGQRHFDVQLIGGMVLHDGRISEMRPAKERRWLRRCRSISMPWPVAASTSSPSTTISLNAIPSGWDVFTNFLA